MQFLLMCLSESIEEQMSEEEQEKLMEATEQFVQDIVRSGHYRSSAKLETANKSATIRTENGQIIIHDGPYIETREQLGGFFLVECKDMEEAIEIGKKIPAVGAGGMIEIRQVARQ